MTFYSLAFLFLHKQGLSFINCGFKLYAVTVIGMIVLNEGICSGIECYPVILFLKKIQRAL